MNSTAVIPVRVVRSPAPVRAAVRSRQNVGKGIVLRQATPADVDAVHALIVDHRDEGRLLPRDHADVQRRITRFVVGVRGRHVIACGELAPLSPSVAEVRSLVVSRDARGGRIGERLVEELVHRAARGGHVTLCAFTHAPAYFVRLGFSMVPPAWIPEKISADCQRCPQFTRCGQYAVVRTLPNDRTAARSAALRA